MRFSSLSTPLRYCRALIKNSNDHSGRGYNVVGPDSWDPWERWVRLEHIKPTNMFDLIEMYCIEDYRERDKIEKRVMELLYEITLKQFCLYLYVMGKKEKFISYVVDSFFKRN